MTASTSSPPQTRLPLRLRLSDHPGQDRLDGGWWPQSRDLAVELADLVEHLPADLPRIQRALFSPPDWDDRPHRVPLAHGYLKAGSFPEDDTHLIELRTADHRTLHLLVVPAGFTHGQGEEALLASATPGNRHSAASLLTEVLNGPDGNDRDRWSDEGGAWWDPAPLAPSFRTTG